MTLRKIFKVQYFSRRGDVREMTHEYEEHWENTDLYCPKCGKHDVWHDASGGDYYVGENHMCLDCGAQFTIQGPYAQSNDEHEPDVQRFAKLRS